MRNEIITMVNKVFDENIDLKIRNTYLEAKNQENDESCSCKKQEKTKLDKKIIDYGRKKLADELLKTYGNEVRVSRDEETKEIKCNSFDNWFDSKLYSRNNIPKNMTYEEVKELTHPYAKELYEKEKLESIKKFEEKEREAKESE